MSSIVGPPIRDPAAEQALAAAPHTWDLRLEYATWLEGWDQHAYAHAQRWLARKQRHPIPCRLDMSPPLTLAVFGGPVKAAARPAWLPYTLPGEVHNALARRLDPLSIRGPEAVIELGAGRARPLVVAGAGWLYFASAQAAVEELAAALAGQPVIVQEAA